jgi:hypothetical protein
VASALALLLSALITCTGAIVGWQADLAGSAAADYDRQGVVEAVRFQGEAQRAETDARTEERTFAAYAAARVAQRASRAQAPYDEAAAVEALAQRRLADRLARGFAAGFVRQGTRDAGATFDTRARAAELLREREVRDDSARLFARGDAEKERRQSLLAVAGVLVLGLAATAFAQLSTVRHHAVAGAAAGLLAFGYGVAALVAAWR